MPELSTAEQIVARCMVQPAAPTMLRRLCDTVGGRISGLESGRRAEELCAGMLRDAGLPRVTFEAFPVIAWERGSVDAEVIAPHAWPLTALAHGNAPSAADVTAPIIDMNHGEAADYARTGSVAGRIAICDEGASPGARRLHRTERLALAIEHGAEGLIIISPSGGMLPRTGVCCAEESPIPSVGIALEDGERLRRLLETGASSVVRLRMKNRFVESVARNVIAEIPGTDLANEIVLAGAHLDSWDVSQGATDNGLGTAIVLEMARVLARLPAPRRTMRFALWAAEEVGLFGSTRYSEEHSEELGRHAAVLNFDMTGSPCGYWCPGRPEQAEILRQLDRQMIALGMTGEYGHDAGLHSDHQPFMLAGVPVLALRGQLEGKGGRYYHSTGDTFEKVSIPGLCRASAVATRTMFALANEDQRSLTRLSPTAVGAMVSAAGLGEALAVSGWAPPAEDAW